jgi:UDP-glucose 4-epimerase
VYGTDYDTPDGTCIRDYVHVSDLCEAHWLALESLRDGASSQAYNLGNGNGFSVLEVIETAKKVTGVDFAVKHEARRAGDPPRLVADSSAIKAKLGWSPRYADLDTIIAHAWAFERSRKPS